MLSHNCAFCGNECSCGALSTEDCWGCAYCLINPPGDDEEDDDDE